MSTYKTGYGTAALRSIETQKKEPLIEDKYAKYFAGKEGFSWVEGLSDEKRNLMLDLLAVRTKVFDEFTKILTSPIDNKISSLFYEFIISIDELNPLFKEIPKDLTQIVILGAGYDSKALRLNCLSNSDVFEIDVVDVLERKKEIINDFGININCQNYKFVPFDLSHINFGNALVLNGFDKNRATIWMLEGLSGYLDKETNKAIIKHISSLSSKGSVCVSTFIGSSGNAFGMKEGISKIHSFFSDIGYTLYATENWKANQVKISKFSEFYKRNDFLKDYDYWIVCAVKK